MTQSQIKEHITENIKEIKLSIIELTESNDKGALILANNDLKYYETLLSGFSIPARVKTVSN